MFLIYKVELKENLDMRFGRPTALQHNQNLLFRERGPSKAKLHIYSVSCANAKEICSFKSPKYFFRVSSPSAGSWNFWELTLYMRSPS